MKMSNSFHRVKTIAKKEVIEFVRDWRTIVAIIIIPILMFPVLFIVFPILLESEAAELDSRIIEIEVQGDQFPDQLVQQFNYSTTEITFANVTFNESLSIPGDDFNRVRNMEIDAVLRLNQTEDIWYYSIIYLSTSEGSTEARSRIVDSLINWEANLTEVKILEGGLDVESTLDPLRYDGDISQSDVATEGEQAGLILSLFIPLVLAIWTFSSAIQPSIDMTAGERERGTLEALLGLPCTRNELLMGKWLGVASITGVGVMLQIVGLLFAIGYLATSDFIGIPDLSFEAIILIIASIMLFAIMVVALELALAMRSHSVKEAGSILGPAIILIIFPALFTQVINLDGIESFWFSIPVINVLLALRELLLDRVIVEHVLIWSTTSVLYAVLAALYAAKQFKREDIVTTLS
ncbi:MAG: ABC transporter permease [Candidatus Poseidoniaceae archaeon]|nr:ABC transporter permease [Candidatus Poseidoniaceae archaeon]MBL6895794.1 ABC transporter permease [Candidatus Poseidoniaceae archaeon]MDA8545319.1 ABC transporter permease subunit [Candidatus Poseidoniales archaeon]